MEIQSADIDITNATYVRHWDVNKYYLLDKPMIIRRNCAAIPKKRQ